MNRLSRFVFAALAAMVAGCASQPPAPVADSQVRTYDGLYPVENVGVTGVWARPDIDLSGYERIQLEGAGIRYRPVPAGDRADAASSEGGVFPLNAEQKARLANEFGAAFRRELSRSEHFRITEAVGPDVLKVRAGLLDVVSRVPPDAAGRTDLYLESLGEATLMIELVDSESGTVLLRAIDRQVIPGPGGDRGSNPVTSWQEVRRLADTWAGRLRDGLDGLHQRMTLE